MKRTRKITLADLYKEHRQRPTPAQEFIEEVARVTEKSTATVKQWLCGTYKPDALACKIIAKHFNVDPNYLFK